MSGISLKKKGEDEVSVCLCPEKNTKTLMLVVCMPVNQLVYSVDLFRNMQ